MPFHRYQDPTYNLLSGGSFPGTIGTETYDRINVTSGGVGGGDGSANADGAKVGGPNVGTYFVAFGEDSTSLYANRGMRALSQNTDSLDNILRGSIPYVDRSQVSSTGGLSLAIPGEMFVGEYGLVPSSTIYDMLFHIENVDGSAVYVNGGAPITVSALLNGSSVNVVGTSADGFASSVTAVFTVPLPAGTYNIVVGRRTSYAQLLESKLHYLVGEILSGRNYDTKNWVNFTAGLDEKYRRSTNEPNPSSAPLNTPGSGAVITRDGQAVTMSLAEHAWNTSTPGADPFDAGIIVQLPNAVGTPGITGDYDRTLPGNMGYVHFTNRRGSNNTGEGTRASQPLASFVVLNPMDVQDVAVGAGNALTYVPEGTAAVLNPTGANSNYVQIAAPFYFRNPDTETTAILCGFDGLLITVDGVSQWWIIDSIVDDETVSVVTPGGLFAFFATATVATIQWVQFCCCLGGSGLGWGGLDTSHHWAGITWSDPMRLRQQAIDWPAAGYQEDPPTFIGVDSTKDVLRAYAFNPTDGSHDLGWHITAGGVFSPGSFVDIAPGASELGGAFFKTNQGLIPTVETLGNGYNTVTIDVWQASMVWMAVDPAATSAIAATLSVQTVATGGSNPNYLATTGDHIEVFLDTRPNTSQIILLLWTVLQFAFSEGDDQVPTGVAAVYRWTGTMGADGRFYMTRTDYNS